MWDITKESIEQCALTLGQFDSETVKLLVTLFHDHNTCSRLAVLSNNLKEKFENLLSAKIDDDKNINDTPITRIELATMLHFKEKYLSELMIGNNDRFKLSSIFSIEDELNLAYCFLLARIDDFLSQEMLNDIKFLLKIRQSATCLFDIYTSSGEKFSKFFFSLLECKCFARKLVAVDGIIRDFQIFIKRYEDFLIRFEQQHKPDTENNVTQTDAIINQNNPYEVSSFIMKMKIPKHEKLTTSTSVSAVKTSNASASCTSIQQTVVSSSSLNIPEKGLCVIINIKKLASSDSVDTTERAGSDKDVELIKLIFKKLKFTILECKFDFKKNDLERALNYIDDPHTFGNFDCLVMFIMSHGLLHSFFTADVQEVVIRDIVKRYNDSSTTTIWVGKPRLFFIQACRSSWPENIQSQERAEVEMKDLSPKMLVAYSCSARQESKRCTKTGSSFIQMLCIMLFRYAPYLDVQSILTWTANFVIKRNEYIIQHDKKSIAIQRPEYIEREFSSKFRFSNSSLSDTYDSWKSDEKTILNIPLHIWDVMYEFIFNSSRKDS